MSTLTHRLRHSPAPPPQRSPADAVDISKRERKDAVAHAEPDIKAAPQYLRLGSIGLRSAAVYLLVWALVLFVVTVAVFAAGYAALERLGVLASLSESAATVLSQPLPESGMLPALEWDALLPFALLGAGALSLLWLFGSFAFVCVHNAVCKLTSGLRIRTR